MLRTELLRTASGLVTMPIARLRAATDQDSALIRALLDSNSLPTSDLEAARPLFVVAYMDEQVIGTGALQSFGPVALLRSIVVEPRLRGAGVGQSIVRELEHIARTNEIKQLILLTQTAKSFFEAQGYVAIDRANAPPAVQESEEFRSLCPASAVCMSKALQPYNVLFLCTGNSARSILAESLVNHWGKNRFRGFSAGSFPKGTVHPLALETLKQRGFPTEGFRSKSWDEFAAPGAPSLDFIFTVCDNAAGEVCPTWPGKPITAHWGIPDPAAVEGTDSEKAAAFQSALQALENRIKAFISLPIASLDKMGLKSQLDLIGRQNQR